VPVEKDKARSMALHFYAFMKNEVIQGNPRLDSSEQQRLRSHYPLISKLSHYPPEIAATIYSSRRSHAIKAILDTELPYVFDAGCGYGSESFLFAGLGAKVLAVDMSAEQIRIARKRQYYYEEHFEKPLDITFTVADLDEYKPDTNNVSLTWLASVLAAVRNQNKFLETTCEATRPKGQVMITDMNLFNPLFLFKEWSRRQQTKKSNLEFARKSDFWSMIRRRGRTGARYLTGNNARSFDDVQFFSSRSLSDLLDDTGFVPKFVDFSGFVPPQLWKMGLDHLENVFSRLPFLRQFGYFYLVAAIKQ